MRDKNTLSSSHAPHHVHSGWAQGFVDGLVFLSVRDIV